MIKTKFKSVDEYIDSFPKETKVILGLLRKTIKEVVPEVEEKISYNIPAFTLNGKYLIYFAAWKKYISLYPYNSELEKKFKEETKSYKKSGKGTIQFPLDKELPLSLIKKIVAFKLTK